MLNDYQDKLEAALQGKYRDVVSYQPRTSKADVMDYYKAQYGKGGNHKAAEALHALGIVKNRAGETVGIKSLMRRFQTRGGKSQSENSAVYAALGKNLPAKEVHTKEAPTQFKLTVEGQQRVSSKHSGMRQRSFEHTFTGSEAKAMIENPSLWAFFYAIGYDDIVDDLDSGTYELEDVEVN